MRFRSLYLFAAGFWLLAASPSESCMDAESMISFIERHIGNAMQADAVSMVRYHTFKAINTLEKSRSQLENCGCDYAKKYIGEGLEDLKLATRVNTVEGSRILLNRALTELSVGRDALEMHDAQHDGPFGNDVLALNTQSQVRVTEAPKSASGIEAQIDASLEAYKTSLDEVVRTVPCREAREFVQRIYDHCERQLLREDLTPAKRYYNLRTKVITENALNRVADCANRR